MMRERWPNAIQRCAIVAILAASAATAQNHSPTAPKNPTSPAAALNNQAVSLSRQGQDKQAEEKYRAALEAASGNDLVYAKIASNLATLYQKQDRYRDAEGLFRCALELRQKNLPSSNIDVSYSLNNLGEIYRIEGQDWDARNLMEQAVRDLQEFHSEAPGLPIIQTNLAVVLVRFHQFDQTEELLRSALISFENHQQTASRGYGVALTILGQILETKDDFANAEPPFQRAIGIFERMGAPGRTDLAATLAGAAELYQHMDRTEEAQQTIQRALGLLHPSGDELLRARILQDLGNIMAAAGHPAVALPYFKRSLAIQEQILGDQHPNTAGLLLDYSSATLRAGNKSLAHKLRKRAMDLLARIADHSPAQMTVSLRDLEQSK